MSEPMEKNNRYSGLSHRIAGPLAAIVIAASPFFPAKYSSAQQADTTVAIRPYDGYTIAHPPGRILDERIIDGCYSFLDVQKDQSINDAITQAIPQSYDEEKRNDYVSQMKHSMETLGYDLSWKASQKVSIPYCIRMEGCDIDALVGEGYEDNQGSHEGEQDEDSDHQETNDQGEDSDQEEGDHEEGEQDKESQRTPIPRGQSNTGMNPAVIYTADDGMPINGRIHIEAGYILGGMSRTDEDTLEIRDPVTGSLISTASLEKLLETETNGYYTNISARAGNASLVSLRLAYEGEEGNFSINDTDVDSYTRETLSADLGVRTGLYEIPGKFFLTGGLALGYQSINDRAEDDLGTYESNAEMCGVSGRLDMAFSLTAKGVQYMPGLGVTYDYHSNGDDDVYTMLMTRAGIYDTRWSSSFSTSLYHNYILGNTTITEKELESVTEANRIAFAMLIQNRVISNAMVGFDMGYLEGTYSEDLPGNLVDVEGDVIGYDASLWLMLPNGEDSAIVTRIRYEQREIDFGDEGSQSDGMVSLGVGFQW